MGTSRGGSVGAESNCLNSDSPDYPDGDCVGAGLASAQLSDISRDGRIAIRPYNFTLSLMVVCRGNSPWLP
ncbi:MAG: hypothetical protein KAS97_01550, partial [Candidatus Aminicenantes bacterium]|nr:hypothetical protein [Candidatus Aminicenantes bacterium]